MDGQDGYGCLAVVWARLSGGFAPPVVWWGSRYVPGIPCVTPSESPPGRGRGWRSRPPCALRRGRISPRRGIWTCLDPSFVAAAPALPDRGPGGRCFAPVRNRFRPSPSLGLSRAVAVAAPRVNPRPTSAGFTNVRPALGRASRRGGFETRPYGGTAWLVLLRLHGASRLGPCSSVRF